MQVAAILRAAGQDCIRLVVARPVDPADHQPPVGRPYNPLPTVHVLLRFTLVLLPHFASTDIDLCAKIVFFAVTCNILRTSLKQ